MQHFLDLQATDFTISVEMQIINPSAVSMIMANGNVLTPNQATKFFLPLLLPVEILVKHQGSFVSSLKFDGWESRPQHGIETPGCWMFNTGNQNFYRWHHTATGQGWLILPN